MVIANRWNANLLWPDNQDPELPFSPWIYWVVSGCTYRRVYSNCTFPSRETSRYSSGNSVKRFFLACWFPFVHIVLCSFFQFVRSCVDYFSFFCIGFSSFLLVDSLRFYYYFWIHAYHTTKYIIYYCNGGVNSSVKHQILFDRFGISETKHSHTKKTHTYRYKQ